MIFRRRGIKNDSFTDLIGIRTIINGSVEFGGIMKIEGTVVGGTITGKSVDTKDAEQLVIEPDAMIRVEEIKSHNLIIGGVVNAKKVWVEGTLRITSTGKVSGAILYYRNLEIEDGAFIHECVFKHLDHASEGEQT
jgi:cytoskeletal protein CcmA (bactofilin family)